MKEAIRSENGERDDDDGKMMASVTSFTGTRREREEGREFESWWQKIDIQ